MRAMTFCSLLCHRWLIVTLRAVSWTHAFDQPTFKISQFFLFIITWNRKLFFSNLSSAIRLHYRNIQNWCQEKVEDISNEAVPTRGWFSDLTCNSDEAFVEGPQLRNRTKAIFNCLKGDFRSGYTILKKNGVILFGTVLYIYCLSEGRHHQFFPNHCFTSIRKTAFLERWNCTEDIVRLNQAYYWLLVGLWQFRSLNLYGWDESNRTNLIANYGPKRIGGWT